SASYKIASENINFGKLSSSSLSYAATGVIRDRQLNVLTGTGYIVGEGFLKGAYVTKEVVVLAPIVTSVTPSSGTSTGTINITEIAGANFVSGASVKLTKTGESDIVGTSIVVVSASKITCTFDLTGKASGAWTITVTNTDGKSGSLPSAFTIGSPSPTITSITPKNGTNNSFVDITALDGTNFRSGAQVKLVKTGDVDIIATSVNVSSATQISCRFDITGKTVGLWDVTVTNDDNQSATLSQGFKIEAQNTQIVGVVESTQNPYNPTVGTTSIKYTLSKDAEVTIYVYNIRGERIWEWHSPAGASGGSVGTNEIIWDGMTAFKSRVSNGVYIVEIMGNVNGSVVQLGRTKLAVIK
ncbi:MAG: hypothetical protein WCV91_07145, partial [Candidatus Margulisiibacteriota bacterium]